VFLLVLEDLQEPRATLVVPADLVVLVVRQVHLQQYHIVEIVDHLEIVPQQVLVELGELIGYYL
jgi:hypothetical protein